jgi:hypothetical protein
LPPRVFGPQLFLAFCRFAAICFSLAIPFTYKPCNVRVGPVLRDRARLNFFGAGVDGVFGVGHEFVKARE